MVKEVLTDANAKRLHDLGLEIGSLSDEPAARLLLRAGRANAGIIPVDDQHPEHVTVAVPEGLALQAIDKYLANPLAKQATHQFFDVASLADYLGDQDEKKTRIFCSVGRFEVKAVLDYHDEKPEFGRHVAALKCELHKDWEDWTGKNEDWLSQTDFADFLDQHAANVAEPDSATVLECISRLEMNKSVVFKSFTNLTNGTVQFAYSETEEAPATQKMSVPKELILGLSVFKHGKPQAITAKIRYRIGDGGKLRFMYLLNEPEKAEEMAFMQTVEDVRSKCSIAKGIFLTA